MNKGGRSIVNKKYVHGRKCDQGNQYNIIPVQARRQGGFGRYSMI